MSVAVEVAALRGRLRDDRRPVPPPGTRLAGVLVPLVVEGGATVVFTRRTAHLSRHAGEISFPGGLEHAEDDGLRATALRETHEELGLDPRWIDVLGALPAVHTFVSGILIVPFVGALERRRAFLPNAAEIDEVLEFSVDALDVAEAEVELPRDGRVYRGYAYEMPDATIWGATARILHDLLQTIRAGAVAPTRGDAE